MTTTKRKRKPRSDKGVKRGLPAPTDGVVAEIADVPAPRRRVGMYEVGEQPVACDRVVQRWTPTTPAVLCGSTNSRVLGEYYTTLAGVRYHHRRRQCQDCKKLWVTKTEVGDE